MNIKSLEQAFEAALKVNKQAQSLLKTISSGRSNYNTVRKYSEVSGEIWSKILLNAFGTSGYADFDDINGPLKQALETLYTDVVERSFTVQSSLNKRAGISLKAVKPKIDYDRIDNLAYKLGSDALEKTSFVLNGDELGNFARSAVNSTIERNAEVQKEAGLRSYLVRNGSGCCAFCDSLTGRYEWGSEPENFWMVHRNCTCEILYQPAKATWQKITYSTTKTTDSSGKATYKVSKNTADV